MKGRERNKREEGKMDSLRGETSCACSKLLMQSFYIQILINKIAVFQVTCLVHHISKSPILILQQNLDTLPHSPHFTKEKIRVQ